MSPKFICIFQFHPTNRWLWWVFLNLFPKISGVHEHVMGKQILPKQVNVQDFWILEINRIKILIETL